MNCVFTAVWFIWYC